MVGLNDFTSVFQLLAALCILFFYDDLLKHVTPTSARENAIKYVDSISTSLQGFDGRLANKLSRIANNAKIEYFNSVVSHVGKTYFIFLFAILIFAANYNAANSPGNHQDAQQWCLRLMSATFILSAAVAIYSIIVMWCRQCTWCRRYWSFGFASLAIIAYALAVVFNLYLPIQIPMNWAQYAVILSLIIVTIWIVATFYYDERKARLFEKDLKNVSDKFQSFANWALQPNSFKKFREIDLSLKWHINFTDTPEYAREIVYPILKQDIESILDRHANGYVRDMFKPCIKIFKLTDCRIFG